jgi:hypothetical protein
MNWFPQIVVVVLVQLPLHRRRKWREIVSEMESGERISLPDLTAGEIEWRLSYRDLSDAEVATLEGLFRASKGRFGAFGFADPIANLLAWSEDLSRPDWQYGVLSSTSGVADPVGTQRASSFANGGAGIQALSQTVGVPGIYTGCFSAWLRSNSEGQVTLRRDGVESVCVVGAAWKRAFVTGAGDTAAGTSSVSVVIAAGQSVDVWGLQFEVQPYPSQYKPTRGASRIYEESYFGADELTMTSTGVGLTACEIPLVSRV